MEGAGYYYVYTYDDTTSSPKESTSWIAVVSYGRF